MIGAVASAFGEAIEPSERTCSAAARSTGAGYVRVDQGHLLTFGKLGDGLLGFLRQLDGAAVARYEVPRVDEGSPPFG